MHYNYAMCIIALNHSYRATWGEVKEDTWKQRASEWAVSGQGVGCGLGLGLGSSPWCSQWLPAPEGGLWICRSHSWWAQSPPLSYPECPHLSARWEQRGLGWGCQLWKHRNVLRKGCRGQRADPPVPGVTRERMLPLKLFSTRAFSFRGQNVQRTWILPVEKEKKIRENGQVHREPPKSRTPCRKPRMWARVAVPRVTVAERSHLVFTLFFLHG